jgi:predicted ArsR family transcriptional regulator
LGLQQNPKNKGGVILGLSIEQLPETRQTILRSLKRNGPATIAELASQLEMTREAIRQHLLQLEYEGWIGKELNRDSSNGGGRPSTSYSLTADGDHLFPKHYDSLTVEVLDTVANQLGPEALIQVLSTMTKARVQEWETRLQGLKFEERIEALKGIYLEDDAFMEVEHSRDQLSLIERNCPFLNVAKRRPVLCSVTVSTLTRLLGYRVIREERFQNGDGRCVFRVLLNEPLKEGSIDFTLES